MLKVEEAQAIVLKSAMPLPPAVAPLTSAALGMVLAEDIASDIDSPPYDKAMMDGFAVRTADLPEGKGVLQVIEEVTAGRTPQLPIGPGQASRIMTGAPVPAGADAVVPLERSQMLDGQQVQLDDRTSVPGGNILTRGREMARGQLVLRAGTVLRPQVFGLLASVGRTAVRIHPQPTVAVMTTGDEVVEANQTPGPGQIRNSNGPMLVAQVSRAGGLPRYLGIGRDTVQSLRPLVAEGLRADVLVLSGGVSAGRLDLVPGVLQELGVQAHFHKVEMKPGKPVFFGARAGEAMPASECEALRRKDEPGVVSSLEEVMTARSRSAPARNSPCLVFGLPGNPVSSLVCFELFVRPALRCLLGHAECLPPLVPLPLAGDFPYASDRPTYHPARLQTGPDGWQVRPLPWFGSADLRALAEANALVLFPAGNHQHRAGQRLPVLALGEDRD
jgi:molybdopterin molybdotransferase